MGWIGSRRTTVAGTEGGGREGQIHALGHHDVPSTSLHVDEREEERKMGSFCQKLA